MSQYQENGSSSSASIEGPVKYGELIALGDNYSHFALCQRPEANGVKPSTVHMDCNPQEATAISMMEQHSITFKTEVTTVVVEFAHDRNTDMFQIGRSTEGPIDFVVTDTVPHGDRQISRFACRIICQRSPPYTARIYAAGFDSSKNIFMSDNAVKWQTPDGQMDGLTTNGVLVKHPLHSFREFSVLGNAYTLRETRSAQQQGWMVHGESQELVDGSLIDLCGVTLLWRTAESLAQCTPTLEALIEELCVQRPPWANLQCGHVLGSETEVEVEGQERECPICQVRGPYVPLQMGSEVGLFLDAAPLTHAFVPCGHLCSEKTATFWSQMSLLPHGENSFHAACPFCVQRLTGDTGYIRLVWDWTLPSASTLSYLLDRGSHTKTKRHKNKE